MSQELFSVRSDLNVNCSADEERKRWMGVLKNPQPNENFKMRRAVTRGSIQVRFCISTPCLDVMCFKMTSKLVQVFWISRSANFRQSIPVELASAYCVTARARS